MSPLNADNSVRPTDHNDMAGASSSSSRGRGHTEGEHEIELQEDTDEEDEIQKPKIMKDPRAPTQKEIDEHNVTHLPFRAWCTACVTGAAKDRPHYRDSGCAKMDTIVFDYGFLGTDDAKQSLPIQIMKHVQT